MKNGEFEQCVTLLVERFEFEKKSLESCFRRKEKKTFHFPDESKRCLLLQ